MEKKPKTGLLAFVTNFQIDLHVKILCADRWAANYLHDRIETCVWFDISEGSVEPAPKNVRNRFWRRAQKAQHEQPPGGICQQAIAVIRDLAGRRLQEVHELF